MGGHKLWKVRTKILQNTKNHLNQIIDQSIFTPLVFNFIRFFLKQIHPKSPENSATSAATLRICIGFSGRCTPPGGWNVTFCSKTAAQGFGCFFLGGGGSNSRTKLDTIHGKWYIYLHEWLIFNVECREIYQSHGWCYGICGLFCVIWRKNSRLRTSISFLKSTCDTKNKMQIQNRRFSATFLANAKFPDDFSTVHTSLPHSVVFPISRLRTVGNVWILKRESGHWKVKPNHLDAEMSILRWMVKQNENHYWNSFGLQTAWFGWTCHKLVQNIRKSFPFQDHTIPGHPLLLCIRLFFFCSCNEGNVLPLSRTWSFKKKLLVGSGGLDFTIQAWILQTNMYEKSHI